MSRIVLLPDWPTDAEWNEVIGKVFPFDPDKRDLRDVKKDWKPNFEQADELEKIEAFAFPTPFAWAEMMSAIIQAKLFNHLLFRLYKELVLGVVLNQLQLEIVDLKDEKLSFGKVLASVDPRYRYLGLLRGTKQLQGKVYGSTSSDSLFWPSPRRTKNEWKDLENANSSHANLEEGYGMLADLRDLLDKQKLWNPDKIPWMNGLSEIIGDRKPSSGNKLYHSHSRQVGPVLASFPNGSLKPFYLPVHEKAFATQYLKALTGFFKQEQGKVAIVDYVDRTKYEIKMPNVTPDGDRVLAGAGTIQIFDTVANFEQTTRVRLIDDEKGDGLFSLLQPLYESLRRDQPLYGTLGMEGKTIKERPYFYPDAIRITVARLGEAGLRHADVSFSERAYNMTFEADSPGLPLLSDLGRESSAYKWCDLLYEHNDKPMRAIFLEKYAGYDISDLAALGWVLCSFFTRAADYANGNILEVERSDSLFKDGKPSRPFDLENRTYIKLNEQRDKYRKLATLQRFIRAYGELARSKDASDTDKLFYAAADAFIRCVWPDRWASPDQPVIENGRPPSKWEEVRLGKFTVNLARD